MALPPLAFPTGTVVKWGARVAAEAWAFYEAYLESEHVETDDLGEWRRCQAQWTRTTPAGTSEDRAICTYDFANFTDGHWDSSWTAGDYTTLEALLQTMFTAFAGWQNSNHSLLELRWFRMSFPDTMSFAHRFNPTGPPERVTPMPTTGQNNTTSTAMPYQVAATVTEKTPIPKHWGRWYYPGISPNAIDGNSRIKTSVVDVFGNAAAAMYQGANAAELPGIVPVTQIQKVLTKKILNVSEVQVDDLPDIQRRRRPKQSLYKKKTVLTQVEELPAGPRHEPVPLTWLFNFARRFNLSCSSTSGGVHVAGSYHYAHRAMDLYGAEAEMLRCMRIACNTPRQFAEAFHDPFGRYIKDGVVHFGSIGGHADHVHLARQAIQAHVCLWITLRARERAQDHRS